MSDGSVKAFVHTEGWAGRGIHEVEVLGQTPKRFRVRVVQPWTIRATRRVTVGEIVLVPKHAVRDDAGLAFSLPAAGDAP